MILLYFFIPAYLVVGVLIAMFEHPFAFDNAVSRNQRAFVWLGLFGLVIFWLPYAIHSWWPEVTKCVAAVLFIVGWAYLGLFVLDISGIWKISDNIIVLPVYYGFFAFWFGIPLTFSFMVMNHKTKT